MKNTSPQTSDKMDHEKLQKLIETHSVQVSIPNTIALARIKEEAEKLGFPDLVNRIDNISRKFADQWG